MHACLATVVLRIFKNSGYKKINLPCLGEVTVVGVLPFCLAFSIFWAADQHISYAWVRKMFWGSANGTSTKYKGSRGANSGGEAIPMLLRIPRFCYSWGGYDMILIPGLLVAFSFRNDRSSKKGILICYGICLILTYSMGEHGQPALLSSSLYFGYILELTL